MSCDHSRAVEYFIESILNPGELTGKKCESWKSYLLNQCEGETVALGDLKSTTSGSFYLETNRDRPYSRSGKSTSGIGLQKVLTFLKP